MEALYKAGKSEEDKIEVMRDVLGDDGNALYKKYAVKSGVVSEGEKDSRPSHYEKLLYKKMKEWKIKSLDELEGEAKTRFDKELEDYEGADEDEVEVNMPNMGEGLFPEMNRVKGRGTIDYGERGTNEKSLTASSFSDGNLYPEHLTQKFIPPSTERMRHIK